MKSETDNSNEKKTLIIVESPTKAKSISSMLPHCIVLASMGHIRDLPPDKMGIDLKTFTPEYEVPEDKKAIVKELKKALKEADRLILATDEDREGESIARHLEEVLNPKISVGRMVFHEITKKAILEAFEHPRDIDVNMVNAQEARRVLDRLFGYSISPLLWNKLSLSKLSAGRVQSPTLRLLVDRELERMKYKKSEYYVIKGIFTKDGSKGFNSTLEIVDGKRCAVNKDFYDEVTGELKDSENTIVLNEEKSDSILTSLADSKFIVEDIKAKEIERSSLAPFITSTLQQEANTKLHYTTGETMRLAQSLYEKGFITYMRTDSPTLSYDAQNAARMSVKTEYGDEYLLENIRNFTSKDKNAQEAHEAIRPAIINGIFVHPDDVKLQGREKSLYSLIYRRTIATQMKNSRKLQTQLLIRAEAKDSHIYYFVSRGVKIVFPGFLKAYDKDEDKENILPHLEIGTELSLESITKNLQETSPRSRYTEATLIKKMEDLGIGRPSTYATTVTSIITKQYVTRVQNTLAPTFLGVLLSEFLEGYFTKYVDYDFTSNMEKSLDEIASNTVNSKEYLENFYRGKDGLEPLLEERASSIKSRDAKKLYFPTIDKEKYDIRYGKYGPYIQLGENQYKGFPNDWLPGDITEEKLDELIKDDRTGAEKLTDRFTFLGKSDVLGKDIYYAKEGKFGPYWVLGSVKDKESVKFLSVPKGTKGEDWSFKEVEGLFSLPRTVGMSESGEPIVAGIGRYGAYIALNKDFRSLSDIKQVLTITEEEANKILSEPKPEKKGTSTFKRKRSK